MSYAVLLDAGGVLVLPDPARMREGLRPAGVTPGADQLDRAHYRAVAATDALGHFDRGRYLATYAEYCGVGPDQIDTIVASLGDLLTGSAWSRVVPGAVSGLRALVDTGTPVGIVSNSDGTVAEMLAEAGICQVGPGAHTPVRVIVDSTVVGVAKPDPGIFRFALDEMPAADQVLYVGDTVTFDVTAARRAGLRPVHMDPYQDCPVQGGDHEHVVDLAGLLTLIS